MLIELIKMTAFPNKGAFCSREGSNNAFLISLVVLYAVIEEVIMNMHAWKKINNTIFIEWLSEFHRLFMAYSSKTIS